jgi:two-component system sensor histidine kinase BaeS
VLSLRSRLAIGMTALALGVTAVVAIAAAVLADRLGADPQPRTVTRVEQFGSQIAVIQVQTDPEGAAAADQARQDALRWTLIALAASFVPAAGLAWLAAGRVVRPLHRVTDVAGQVRSPVHGGRAADGVDVGGDDELGRLVGEFDRMLDRLDAREREQARLVQEVVHELRTPLAVAGTNLELEGPEHAAAARRALERMSRTVDDLARFGRLRVAATDAVDLSDDADELVAEHRGVAGRRGVTLATAGPRPCVVETDRSALHTIVANLLSNALRFAPGGSTVLLGWGRHAEWAWIGVRDHGAGIEAGDHAHVFERGWRGRADRDRGDEPERGLGLTIARQLVEAQGGVLTVTSGAGEGTSFVAWLPMGAGALREAIVRDDGLHAIVDPLSGATPETPVAAPPTP